MISMLNWLIRKLFCKKAVSRIKEAQPLIDSIQPNIPNSSTVNTVKMMNNPINVSSFTAELVKNKHGENNDGINLTYITKSFGVPIQLSYDPMDGSVKGSIGPFFFK